MDDPSERKAATADSFGDSADGYLASSTHSRGADLERLVSWCDGATVALDVATGAGHTAGALSDAGIQTVIATDAAPAMVETSVDSFSGVTGVVADAERLPLADDTFDAVTCRIAAHHFPAPRAFLSEVARVLRPGGTFAFEDNVAPENDALASFLNRLETMRDPTHVESYRTSTWHQWLVDAGFLVEETAHLVKTLQFEPWIDRVSTLDAEDRDAVRRLLRDATDEQVAFYDVEYENGDVKSFGSLKGLIRAVRAER